MKLFPRQSLRERLADHILDAIVRSELRPGDRIVERRLSHQLGVSQTTLREALLTLENVGLITKVDNQGSSVARLTVENVEELYAVRKQLEPYAAELCYGHMKQADYQGLVTILQKMKASLEGRDYTELSMADAEFHRAIWRLSGNKVLERTLNSVCTPLFALVLVDVGTYDARRAVDEHIVLLEALKRGGTHDVRRAFEEKIEIFRMRDVKNVLALQNPTRHPRRVTGT
jgi:DNA-binding GntR family transcriptional regulator